MAEKPSENRSEGPVDGTLEADAPGEKVGNALDLTREETRTPAPGSGLHPFNEK